MFKKQGRGVFCGVLVLIVFIVYVVRLGQWQLVQGDTYAEEAVVSSSFIKLTGARGLVFAVRRLRQRLELPETLTQAGLERGAVLAKAEEIAEAAANDPCTGSNPRPVTKADFLRLLRAAL